MDTISSHQTARDLQVQHDYCVNKNIKDLYRCTG